MTVLIVKNARIEGPGRLAVQLSEKGINFEAIDAREFVREPPSVRQYDAIFLFGGQMSANDDAAHPFIPAEKRFILRALEEKKPLMGVCLGAQLLARALLAEVKPMRKEIGNFEVQLTEEGKGDQLFAGFQDKFPVFQWHGEKFSVPDGAVNLAKSEYCESQCIKFGENAYGVQFHLEVTPEMIEAWCNEYETELGQEGTDKKELIRGLREKEATYKDLSRKMFGNFFKIANL